LFSKGAVSVLLAVVGATLGVFVCELFLGGLINFDPSMTMIGWMLFKLGFLLFGETFVCPNAMRQHVYIRPNIILDMKRSSSNVLLK
jgi:hypothetical protein